MSWPSRLLEALLPVPPDARRRALLCVALFAGLMTSYYVFKPVRGSLYIHYIGAHNLPYAYLASAGLAAVVMAVYNRFFVRFGAARLLSRTLIALAASAVVLWLVHALSLLAPAPLSVVVFLWVGVYGTLVATLFWSVANDAFDPSTGRRVYGVVGTGGIIGALIGSSLTSAIASRGWLSSESLLLVGAALLLAALPLMRAIPTAARREAEGPPVKRPEVSRRDGLAWILRDGYVAAMAVLVFVTTFTGTVLDLSYNRVVSRALSGKAEKTAYFGRLYAMVNGLGLALQLAVTGPLHRRVGPAVGLYPLPIVGLVAPLVLLRWPALGPVTVVWTLGMALLYSLNQASKEQLYIPTPPDVKYGAKGYIDVVFFRLGDGLASLGAIIFRERFERLDLSFVVVVYVVVVGWLALVGTLQRGYRARIAAHE